MLLLHAWPQKWYAWRMLMPALARDYTVVPDQRGIGLSDKSQDGYDVDSYFSTTTGWSPLVQRGARSLAATA